MNWLPWSLAATVLLGVSMSLYKMPSFKGYGTLFSTFWTNLFSAIFVFVAIGFFNTSSLSGLYVVSWYALIWGALFGINMTMHKMLLRDIETNSLFPVTTSISTVITVLLGVTLLSEHVSLVQTAGMLIIILSVFFSVRKGGNFVLNKRTVLLSIIVLVSGIASKYVQKLGADHDTISHFMLWQYWGAAFFAFIALYIFENKKFNEITHIKKYWKGSILIAIFSTLGGYAILTALSMGPMSGVYAIHPAYIFIAGMFGYLFFKEKLTWKKMLFALLSVIGIILIKIGAV